VEQINFFLCYHFEARNKILKEDLCHPKKTDIEMDPTFQSVAALVAVGFILPIFTRLETELLAGITKSLGGKTYMNGFAVVKAYQNFNKSLEVVATVMIFAGALCGILLGLFTGNKLGYIVALAVSVIGGIIIFTNTADIGINFAKNFLGIGFYFIIIGWIVAAVGIILSAIRK